MSDQTNLENLKKNPMYKLSLGNKELFHSNFLEWLGNEILSENKKSKFLQKIFRVKNENHLNDVEAIKLVREKNNFDISIDCGDTIYVLENKVTSFPTNDQLNKYSKKVKNKKYIIGTLLMLTNKDQCGEFILDESNKDWEIKEYSAVSDFLKTIKEYSDIKVKENEDKYLFLIEKYREYIELLKKILEEEESKEEYDFCSSNEKYKTLDKIKLCDFFFKQRMNSLLTYLKTNFCENDYGYEIGFSKKDPLISIWPNEFRKADDVFINGNNNGKNSNKGRIGVQLQSGKIRFFFRFLKDDLDKLTPPTKKEQVHQILNNGKKEHIEWEKDKKEGGNAEIIKNAIGTNEIGPKYIEWVNETHKSDAEKQKKDKRIKGKYYLKKFKPDFVYLEKSKDGYYSFEEIKNEINEFFEAITNQKKIARPIFKNQKRNI